MADKTYGYIDCDDCPLSREECGIMTMRGHGDCLSRIKDALQTNQFNPDMVTALSGILCDINPAEIASQIANDNLSQWCETIRTEILKEVQK